MDISSSVETGFDDNNEYNVSDDPMLIDFHLGNALNLDIVDCLVTGKHPNYNLFIPRFQKTAWSKLRDLIPLDHKYVVGFLDVTSQLMLLPIERWEVLSPSLWRSLASIVIDGLTKKGINIPITQMRSTLQQIKVCVPEILVTLFNQTLALISSLSEMLRGGENLPYASTWKKNDHILTNLIPGHNLIGIAGRNLTAIVDHATKITYIGNYDSLLLLMDTVGQRLCAFIGNTISKSYNVSGAIDHSRLLKILSIGDRILFLNGNDGYEIIAMFEALVVSMILQKNPDNISPGREFYENCIDETIEICRSLKHPTETMLLIEELINLLDLCSNDILSNIFCMYRIWGHPRVDIHAGMEKVYVKAMADKISLNLSEGLTLCQFRHMFLKNYLAKHRQYPPLTIEGSGYVHECLRKGYSIDHKDSEYVLIDYLTVQIGQIWTVPETYDVCHILNDKAVSPNRSELHQSVLAGHGTIFGTLRRGIIRWMEGDSIRCKEFLDDINDNGLTEDDMIIGMYEKEREIKVKARMFSLMSERMRMYIVLTEELIANHILPYFPEITMKDPLNVQVRKIWKVGGAGQYENNPNINIDFEKWNLNMRPSFTNGLFEQMDMMFGFNNLILRTHDIFVNSYVYSCSGKYNPIATFEGFIPDPPMSYIGHKGGFEGLRQKGWTVATVCLLAYTAWQLKIDMQLLGQGDNQVIKLYMPVKRWENLCYTDEAKIAEARSITQGYLSKMRTNFDDAGLPIKVRETWISTRLFMYGKAMYLDGESLPQWTKKLLRSYALSNEGSVTISGVIGTIATNMTSAAGVSDAPDVMYIIFLFLGEWSLEYLLHYHPFTRRTMIHGQSVEFKIPGHKRRLKTPPTSIQRLMTSLLMIPTAVGGSVTIPLTGFIIRGFPDHASEGYAWLKLLKSVESSYKGLFENWYTFLKNDTMQYDMLIQSPWSLNHLKPPTPGIQSREMVRSWLLSGRFRKNKFLSNMVIINSTFDRKKICEELISESMNPLISYEIFNAFPQSYYDSILRRFEGTRSVRKLAMRESYTIPIIKKLMEVEDRHINYMLWRSEQSGETFSECATEQTRQARNLGWEKNIKGLTTPHPLEFAFDGICNGYNPMCDASDYILVRRDSKGEYPPYLGSRVKTKVISLQDEGARSEPLICANARLARYLKWLDLGKNMIDIVIKSTESLCDTNIFDNFYDLTPGAEGYTGCSEHRFNPAAASDGCFINYAPQLGSKVYMSGDYMPTFGKGKENYTIHFQALYCFLQYISSKENTFVARHHHLLCSTCIVPCDDQIDDIAENHPYIDKAFAPENISLLRETIGFIKSRPQTLVSQTDYLITDNEVPFDPTALSPTGCYYGLIYTLSVKCCLSILTKSGDSDMFGAEDLQSFPRVYSYKLYVDHIMDAMSNILLYMYLMRSGEQLNSIGMIRAKRNMLRTLDRTPLTKFKELASLCIGRNSKQSKIRYLIPTGSFPDDVTTFIRSVKGCLIDTITETTGFKQLIPKPLYIGKLGITSKEYRMLVGTLAVAKFSCMACGETMWRSESFDTGDCRVGHTNKILDFIQLTPASIDRMSKILSIKRKPLKGQVQDLPQIHVSWENYPGSYRRFPSGMAIADKAFRKINLPTSSIYKWSAVTRGIVQDIYSVVIVLGDGTGGTSMIAATHFSEAIIFPLAKFEKHKMIPQDSDSIHPFLSRDMPNVKYDLLEMIPDDILDPSWVDAFHQVLSRIDGQVLLISDIEGVDSELILNQIKSACIEYMIDIVIKVYRDDLSSEEFSDWLPYVVTTDHANTHYGEIFLTNIKMTSCVTSLPPSISKEQRDVERVFIDAVSLSWAIARGKLTSLGLSIGKAVLLGDPGVLINSVLGHINSRYRFPQDRIRIYDPRNLTDGILIKLVRALKIIVLSVSWEFIKDETWYKNLSFARAATNERDKLFMTRKINIVDAGHELVELSVEDSLVARTIRGFRKKVVSIGSYVQLMQIVIDQALSPISQDLQDLILDSESVDDISDLSFE